MRNENVKKNFRIEGRTKPRRMNKDGILKLTVSERGKGRQSTRAARRKGKQRRVRGSR